MMAISISSASTSVSAAVPDTKATTMAPLCHLRSNSKVYFAVSMKPKVRFLSKSSTGTRRTVTVNAQLNKVVANASPGVEANCTPDTLSGSPVQETSNGKKENKDPPSALASEESISEFISQVTNLVKLVDSRDIVELQMKQLDCELLIRKKEAIAPIAPPAPVFTAPSVAPYVAPPVAAPAPPPAHASPPPPASSAPKPAKSSAPPLKSPMAGTFYRSPAPGAPPFVKVGDKVQKGQVVCIVEAMKLMNEIEADQSGTITEIVAEDAKPVSIDTPLLVIQP